MRSPALDQRDLRVYSEWKVGAFQTQRALANHFGVSEVHIGRILRRVEKRLLKDMASKEFVHRYEVMLEGLRAASEMAKRTSSWIDGLLETVTAEYDRQIGLPGVPPPKKRRTL